MQNLDVPVFSRPHIRKTGKNYKISLSERILTFFPWIKFGETKSERRSCEPAISRDVFWSFTFEVIKKKSTKYFDAASKILAPL